ncbi:hypothetical protein FGL86_13965 [Pistricoccus aurantiacus]|uniref:Uncharacterized protein n=1 Tax=Pistricoccus aurantiacus TaxID=1883414 RepID=A0A5B8SUT7_9GAMM|nr:hypothetical protein [Pistricoccus aurantiacus]QEA40074.1 hypothetical protein FGL86_13965 [Pistricoccus aurantiacus]
MAEKKKLIKNRMLLAAGSVMEVWPDSDYAEYMPQQSTEQRLDEHWRHVGQYLSTAMKRYRSQEPARNGN